MKTVILTAHGVEDGELFYPITSCCPPDLPAFRRQIFAAIKQTA